MQVPVHINATELGFSSVYARGNDHLSIRLSPTSPLRFHVAINNITQVTFTVICLSVCLPARTFHLQNLLNRFQSNLLLGVGRCTPKVVQWL